MRCAYCGQPFSKDHPFVPGIGSCPTLDLLIEIYAKLDAEQPEP